MKCKARTIFKVLLATAILCLLTVAGASAETISGTFTDAKLVVPSDSTGSYSFEPNNTYTYEFDTGTGHLTIDAAKNADGSYAHDGEMTLNLYVKVEDSVTGKLYDSGDKIPVAYLPWYDTKNYKGGQPTIDKTKIKSVTIGAGIHKLGRRLLSGTAITELTVPSAISAGEWGVANGCTSLAKVTIEDGAYLGDKFFVGCTALTDVYLQGAIASNSSARCFYYSEAENETPQKINLHFKPTSAAVASVKKLKSNAEKYKIDFKTSAETPYTEFSGEFRDQADKVFTYEFEITSFPSDYDFNKAPAILGKLTVDAKEQSTALTNDDGKLTYPWKSGAWADRVSKIEFGAKMTNIGRQICEKMTALKNVTIPATVTGGIEWGAFLDCSSLESVHAENSNATYIRNRVFAGCGEFDLYLPDSITSIAGYAFDNNNVHSTPTLHWNPGNDETDWQIFANMNANNWENAKLAPNNAYEYDVADTDGNKDAIHFKVDVGTRTLYITKNSVGNGKMANLNAAIHTKQWGKWVNNVEIGEGVKRIGSNAISVLSQLKKIEIGTDVEEMGSYAFNSCGNLEEIVFGDKVTTISERAINGCTKLKKVTFPKSLKTVGVDSTASMFRYSESILNDLDVTEFAPDIEVVGYDGTGLNEWAHGVNADYPAKLTKTDDKWNGEAFCLDVKFLNDDGSVKYVLIKDGSTSAIAKEAETNGYEIVKYGVPMVEIAADGNSASAAFTGAKVKGFIVAAKHDESGMTAVQFGSDAAQNAGYYTINFNETLKNAPGTVSVMLWDGIDTMKPLCASVSK